MKQSPHARNRRIRCSGLAAHRCHAADARRMRRAIPLKGRRGRLPVPTMTCEEVDVGSVSANLPHCPCFQLWSDPVQPSARVFGSSGQVAAPFFYSPMRLRALEVRATLFPPWSTHRRLRGGGKRSNSWLLRYWSCLWGLVCSPFRSSFPPPRLRRRRYAQTPTGTSILRRTLLSAEGQYSELLPHRRIRYCAIRICLLPQGAIHGAPGQIWRLRCRSSETVRDATTAVAPRENRETPQ